ncbi:unnamed protein product [Schistocephalus solidus]|uniref:Reverse transcriptase domain-containing protein n=1 Tax=Schistocephalus solidus TaxID=70667 RepID=A0A183SF99_SCHSO|nr:unnamed protein product [Schistocephalus solidus]
MLLGCDDLVFVIGCLILPIRRIVRSILGPQVITDEVFIQKVTKTERLMNDRSLVRNTTDANEYADLTPQHFLLNCSHFKLNLKWRQAQYLADIFWKKRISLHIGDLVLKAVGEELLKSNDGKVRDVLLRTKQGRLVRDVWGLCPLENQEQNEGLYLNPSKRFKTDGLDGASSAEL